MRYESRPAEPPRERELAPKQLRQLQAVRAKWQGQRVNWPDWQAHATQLKAAYDTMRERRAA